MTTISDEGGLVVRASQCATCIYRPEQGADFIARLEAQIADPTMPGYFRGWRECHTPKARSGTVCRGFWDRHRDHFDVGQIAQRLGLVIFRDRERKGKR